jgi:hypothetical protein
MVVDLGGPESLTLLRLTWSGGRRRPIRVERSTDGVTYSAMGRTARPARMTEIPLKSSARYVAVVVDGWLPGDAEVVELALFG